MNVLFRQRKHLAEREGEIKRRVRDRAEVGVSAGQVGPIVGDDGEIDLFALVHAATVSHWSPRTSLVGLKADAAGASVVGRPKGRPYGGRQYLRITPTTTPWTWTWSGEARMGCIAGLAG